MGDAAFNELLTETAEIERAVVELDSEGGPKRPTYERIGEMVRVRIADLRDVSEKGLLGRIEDVTHVIYARIAEVRVSDRLMTRTQMTALAEDVEAGATLLPVESPDGFREAQCVEIGTEQMTVRSVGDGTLTVTPVTELAYEAGEKVHLIERYAVLAVRDAAGAGHHLRIVAKRLGVRD